MSEQRQNFSNLVNHFIDSNDIELKSKAFIKVNKETLNKEKVFSMHITNKVLKDFGLLDDFVDDNNASVWSDRFITQVESTLHRAKEEAVLGKVDCAIPESRIDPYLYVPFIDVRNNHEVMIDKSIGKVSKLDPETWKRVLSKEEKAILEGSIRLGLLVFDPYQLEPFETALFEGQSVLKVNMYEPPSWMLEDNKRIVLTDSEIEALECPPIIEEFMTFLFPEEDCKNFVYNWMHTALVKRCETYLVLNGKKGAGKGVFCGQLMSSLMGENNHRIAPESILDSIFNSSLDKTRLLVMDEVRVDDDKKLNKLKKYANNKQNIEKKGIDADNVVETFSSNIISNNDIMDMRFTWDERRFSVPEISETTLLDAWGQEKIDGFIKLMEHDDEVKRQFGFWILHKGSDETLHEFSTWKGSQFYQIVYHSLSEWKKVIVDTILAREDEVYSLNDLKKEYKLRVDKGAKFPIKIKRIEAFLNDYRHLGKYKIGSIEKCKEDDDFKIYPDERYCPQVNKSNSVKSLKVEVEDEDTTDLL